MVSQLKALTSHTYEDPIAGGLQLVSVKRKLFELRLIIEIQRGKQGMKVGSFLPGGIDYLPDMIRIKFSRRFSFSSNKPKLPLL